MKFSKQGQNLETRLKKLIVIITYKSTLQPPSLVLNHPLLHMETFTITSSARPTAREMTAAA